MRRRYVSAFTLIELLVVIAIIAVLAAILFPVFAQAREKARTIACLSNARQIGISVLSYAQDYDELIVPWRTIKEYPGQPGKERMWTGRVQPYLRSGGSFPASGVMACPSYSDDKVKSASSLPACDGPGALDPFFPPQEMYAHYGMAFQMSDVAGSGTTSDPYFQYPGSLSYPPQQGGLTRRLPEILRPSETAIITDGVTMQSQGFLLVAFGCEAAQAHQGGANVIFLDGHAKRINSNSERYLSRKSDGSWYKQYYSFGIE